MGLETQHTIRLHKVPDQYILRGSAAMSQVLSSFKLISDIELSSLTGNQTRAVAVRAQNPNR